MITKDFQLKLIEINQKPGNTTFYAESFKDSLWQGIVDLTLYHKKSAKDYIEIIDDKSKSNNINIKDRKVFKNGAIGGYVYYSDEKKWKWRIIHGPTKKK